MSDELATQHRRIDHRVSHQQRATQPQRPVRRLRDFFGGPRGGPFWANGGSWRGGGAGAGSTRGGDSVAGGDAAPPCSGSTLSAAAMENASATCSQELPRKRRVSETASGVTT